MDPRLLGYYNRELAFMREMGGEFAKEYPKIAARLGLESFECADPYVERLLEGFAFLAARVQLKLDAEFPRFTEHLLELVYPHYLAPTPSMAVVQFRPDPAEGSLAEGFLVPRGTPIRSVLGSDQQTPCEYRTAHDTLLSPLALEKVEYFGRPGSLAGLDIPEVQGGRAAIRLRLRATGEMAFNELNLERLPIFIRGQDAVSMHVYEQLLANAVALVVRPPERPAPWQKVLPASQIRPLGFADEEALLPYGPQSFQGYRLVMEYFAFAQRFMFVEFAGLSDAVRSCQGDTLDIVVVLDRANPVVEGALTEEKFALFCAPAVNLFTKRADRIHLSTRDNAFHVVPDRTRPMDFEVHQVTGVTGFGTGSEREQRFWPFYSMRDPDAERGDAAYYTLQRTPRVISSHQQRYGRRSSYVGTETYVSLVDADEAPYRSEIRQLAVDTLCTNRDLPIHMPLGSGSSDFTMELGAPVESIRCVAGPTRPKAAPTGRDTIWRVISHLSLNYLSIADTSEAEGAAALRELLRIYADDTDPTAAKQIDGVKSVSARPIIRRVAPEDRLAIGRGLEVKLTCDETAFSESGVFLLGAVLEQFFARYVSINSFTETALETVDRGEVMRWPTRVGRRPTC